MRRNWSQVIFGTLFSAFVYGRGNMVQITTMYIIKKILLNQLDQNIIDISDLHPEYFCLQDHKFYNYR